MQLRGKDKANYPPPSQQLANFSRGLDMATFKIHKKDEGMVDIDALCIGKHFGAQLSIGRGALEGYYAITYLKNGKRLCDILGKGRTRKFIKQADALCEEHPSADLERYSLGQPAEADRQLIRALGELARTYPYRFDQW
jgi:hypothetical protein